MRSKRSRRRRNLSSQAKTRSMVLKRSSKIAGSKRCLRPRFGRVNQTVGGYFRRLDRRHRRRDDALPDGIRRLESAKFLTKRAQRVRPARWPYQLCWRRCQTIGVAMRLIIEARLEGGKTSETEATTVAVVERKDRSVADLGLTLAEGRALLAGVQSLLVSEQTAGWMESQLACDRCGSMLVYKDARSFVLRTVFCKVDVPSPRLCGKARATAPLRESAVQGRSPACDAGIGVPAGQMGRPSTLPSGH